jgi:hypothetical protein
MRLRVTLHLVHYSGTGEEATYVKGLTSVASRASFTHSRLLLNRKAGSCLAWQHRTVLELVTRKHAFAPLDISLPSATLGLKSSDFLATIRQDIFAVYGKCHHFCSHGPAPVLAFVWQGH